MDFKNKVVLITGAGGSIGSALAEYFAERHAYLALADVNSKALDDIVTKCKQKGATEICTTDGDIAQQDVVEKWISKIDKVFGRIDVLINNAGVGSKSTILDANYLDKYDATFNLNLKTPMRLCHLAVPHLIETKGNIINITSVGGIHPLPDISIYNTSKAALRHFTKCIAMELAPKGVRINSVAPAAVRTTMVKHLGVQNIDEWEKKRAAQLPLKKMIENKEVAELIGFLASDKAKSITGSEFVIDAGHLVGGGAPKYQ